MALVIVTKGRSTFSVHSTVAERSRHKYLKDYLNEVVPQGADPLPLPLRAAKAGRNHLNEELTPPPQTLQRY
jgi:hypothetical protein